MAKSQNIERLTFQNDPERSFSMSFYRTTAVVERIEIVKRHRAGESYHRIAADLHLNYYTVRKWCRAFRDQGWVGLQGPGARHPDGPLSRFAPQVRYGDWIRCCWPCNGVPRYRGWSYPSAAACTHTIAPSIRACSGIVLHTPGAPCPRSHRWRVSITAGRWTSRGRSSWVRWERSSPSWCVICIAARHSPASSMRAAAAR